jgi:SAM-dependent methyltransferase
VSDEVRARELAHHEELYSGFAQKHFAKPAVRALRSVMVRRILRVTGATRRSSVLSLGCGIADTELLLAPHVERITGIDLSPAAIRQARDDAYTAGVRNVELLEGTLDTAMLEDDRQFDRVIAIFFLHHLPDAELEQAAVAIHKRLRPGGMFYSLDPNRFRLSGAVGRILVPKLMRRYQTPDERELDPRHTLDVFARRGFEARFEYFDFGSSPLAGLFPSWRTGYRAARLLDDVLIHVPLLRRMGSNFELIARKIKN